MQLVVRGYDSGPDAMHGIALTRLGQQGLLDLGIGLGDGLAAILTVPMLQAAARPRRLSSSRPPH